MHEVTVLSGKGGTGKTTLTGCFAALSRDSVFTDCDVDAANLSLIMHPTLQATEDFKASRKASIQADKCSSCGLCIELCRFQAISEAFTVNPLFCEGCGVCYHACPEDAVMLSEVVSGKWFISETPYGPLVHARLGIAEENSGKLVTLVRNKAKEIARKKNKSLVITDGPPGIGCPVIASLSGASVALIVTEPTLSAIHDMERVLAVCRHFQVPALLCINRHDLSEENCLRIDDFCRKQEVPLAGKVPLDRTVTGAMLKGVPLVDHSTGPAANSIKKIWEELNKYIPS